MGELSLDNCWEPLRGDPGHTFHICSALVGLKHILPKANLSDVFFWGLFFPPIVQPLYLAVHLRASEKISWCAADRSACSGLRWWESRREERGEKMRRGESEEWREGEHRGAAFQILRDRASHNVAPFLCPPCLFPPPPPLVCHSGLDYFILIRLIPPRGKLLITSPSHSSRRQQSPFSVRTGWGQGFAPLDRREKCERWDWKEALTAAVVRLNEKVWASLVW